MPHAIICNLKFLKPRSRIVSFGRCLYSLSEPFPARFHFGVYAFSLVGYIDGFPLKRLVSAATLFLSSRLPHN